MVRPFAILVCLAWFAVPAQAEGIEWKTPDGRFSFWQPHAPKFVQVDATPPALKAWESKDGRIKVVFMEAEFPSDRKLTLDEAAESLAKEFNGTVVKKESSRGHAADVHTITVKARTNEQDLYVVQVTAAVDGKIYSVRATEIGADPLSEIQILQLRSTATIHSLPSTGPKGKNVFPGSEPPKSVSYRMGQIAGGCLLLALVLAIVFKVTGLGKKKKKKKSRDEDEDDDDPPRRRKRRADDDD